MDRVVRILLFILLEDVDLLVRRDGAFLPTLIATLIFIDDLPHLKLAAGRWLLLCLGLAFGLVLLVHEDVPPHVVSEVLLGLNDAFIGQSLVV